MEHAAELLLKIRVKMGKSSAGNTRTWQVTELGWNILSMDDDLVLNLAEDEQGPSLRVKGGKKGGKWTDRCVIVSCTSAHDDTCCLG
jgi:hypothetical protein